MKRMSFKLQQAERLHTGWLCWMTQCNLTFQFKRFYLSKYIQVKCFCDSVGVEHVIG